MKQQRLLYRFGVCLLNQKDLLAALAGGITIDADDLVKSVIYRSPWFLNYKGTAREWVDGCRHH
ncbi:hypothetical protein [Rubripirellula reticaptiva]|uniref:hypothetical protein n=1 Tax=Rubripirellula reticaptiva TaxID=2528013 RepID=UPI0011B3AF75|nr:hypothetical protein [Rubripirellula reticaptiva]